MKWRTDNVFPWQKAATYTLILLLLAAHLPFINADPDIHISFSRGPFTDEGLNTIQVRNWVNHGKLNFAECDNLLKTPLFGLPLALTYSIFGAKLVISRLHVLVLLTLFLLLLGRDAKNRAVLLIFIPFTLLHYAVFQFSHFSLAEMLSTGAVVLAINFFAKSTDVQTKPGARKQNAFLAAVFVSFAFYFKIQFIYLVPLLPLAYITLYFNLPRYRRRQAIRMGYYSSFTLLIFLLVYFLTWYLPHRDTYEYMMEHQSGTLPFTAKSWEYLQFNASSFLFNGTQKWYTLAFLVAFAYGLLYFRRMFTGRNLAVFIASCVWFTIELHKLTMVYLPTRYRISLLVSMGMVGSVVLAQLISNRQTENGSRNRHIMIRAVAITIFLLITSIHLSDYIGTMGRRAFSIRETNHYLSERLQPGDVVLGAWAPTMTWDSRCQALPVWNGFLNDRDPIRQFNPRVVISEPDEMDSQQAYASQGISLENMSDSSLTVNTGPWVVRIYFLDEPLETGYLPTPKQSP